MSSKVFVWGVDSTKKQRQNKKKHREQAEGKTAEAWTGGKDWKEWAKELSHKQKPQGRSKPDKFKAWAPSISSKAVLPINQKILELVTPMIPNDCVHFAYPWIISLPPSPTPAIHAKNEEVV